MFVRVCVLTTSVYVRLTIPDQHTAVRRQKAERSRPFVCSVASEILHALHLSCQPLDHGFPPLTRHVTPTTHIVNGESTNLLHRSST